MKIYFLRPSLDMVKLVFLAVFAVTFISCTSTVTKKINQTKNLDLIEINGIDFYVDQSMKSTIEECISTDGEVKNRIVNFDKRSVEPSSKVKDELILRKVVNRGNPNKVIPTYHLKSGFYHEVFVCVDKKGRVGLSKLIQSKPTFNSSELMKFQDEVFSYKYEEKSDSSCLDCGNITFKSDTFLGK